MKMSMFSIYDGVADMFHYPFKAHNSADARRAFEESMRGQEMPKNRMTDYTLYHVGDWNDADGTIVPLKVPLKICSGFDIKVEAA
jgi:hypothetical protein